MVWAAKACWLLITGALDFAGGTVVHINAAIAGLVGGLFNWQTRRFWERSIKPHNLPMVFTGTAILYVGWFGFNAAPAGSANEIKVRWPL
ncbi:hypothetical protein KCP78_00870 [Salmonella enterica subsp. enterica]|nr:hypothetical protein KCP78_00870 [Salmonella enterica subsp. enterica]